MSLKSRVEAVLFLTDKPVVAAVVAKLVNEDVQLVRQAIMQLIFDYEQRDCALEISDDDDGYMMQVKDEFANLANDLAPIDLPVAVVRTLSAIAIKQPVMQSDIVRIRGAGAYEHITTLLEKELITKKEEGRSHLLSTTKKFQEYFRLSQDAKALRNQLKDQDKEEKVEVQDQQLELPLENDGLSELNSLEFLPTPDGDERELAAALAAQGQEAVTDTSDSLSPQLSELAAAEEEPAQSDVANWSDSDEDSKESPSAKAHSQSDSESDNSFPTNNDQLMAAPTSIN